MFSASVLVPLLLLTAFGQAPRRAATGLRPPTHGEGSLKVITGHPGSVIFINNIRHGSTSDKGELDLPRVWAGSYPVKVRTAGYTDWKGSVVIQAGSSKSLTVSQTPATDEAVLHYQRAEDLRDKAKNEDAVKEYQQAIGI